MPDNALTNSHCLTKEKVAECISNTPAQFRPQPLWVWNDEVTKERIDTMLGDFAERGIGGVFIHPRPGLVTDYLSDEWFSLWHYALKRCEELGLFCHIYDENSYPSGFGGGHVAAENPLLVRTSLRRRVVRGPEPTNTKGIELLAIFHSNSEGKPASPNDLPNASADAPLIVYEKYVNQPSPFSANFPHTDLLRKENSDAFIKLTHEQYYQHFKQSFGNSIHFAFADEPSVATDGLPISRHFLNRFEQRHGYDLMAKISDLYNDSDCAYATRHDYWVTVHEQFVEGYLKPHHDWCAEHGIGFTGHFLESSWPNPRHQPSNMAALRWLQAPGNDLLGFQFDPQSLEKNGIYLLNLKELDSIKRQCGRDFSLVETTGGGSYGFALRDFKAIEDFVMVCGVNLINPHLSHMTLAGARKYDWAHTISDHAPWWDGYSAYATHIGRVNALLSQGKEQHKVLVLHPSSTGWLEYRAPAEPAFAKQPDPAITQLRDNQADLIVKLRKKGIAFDLGDELVMAEIGRIIDTSFVVGECQYDTLVIPSGTKNLPAATAALIRQFVEAGGRLLTETDSIEYVDGRKGSDFSSWFTSNAGKICSREHLLDTLAESSAYTTKAENGDWKNVLIREVHYGEHKVVFLSHPFDGETVLTIDFGQEPMSLIETDAGEIISTVSGKTEMHFHSHGHFLLISAALAEHLPQQPILQPDLEGVQVNLSSIEPIGQNILAIDYCDLTVNGKTQPSLNTFVADRESFKAHDFDRNPWSFSIQYKNNFLNKPQAADSGFIATYHAHITDEGALNSPIHLAVERAWLYQITVNGQPVSFENATSWFDHNIRQAPIYDYLKTGENEIALHCKPFHALAEIAPIYLLGTFAVNPSEQGFVIDKPSELALGDWVQNGRPFEPFGLRYRFEFELAETVAGIKIDLGGKAEASLVELELDGKPIGQLFTDPWQLSVQADLSAGSHQMDIVMRGNLKNLMGPHFSDGLSGPWSWQYSPQPQPAGKDYRRFPSGLLSAPVVQVF